MVRYHEYSTRVSSKQSGTKSFLTPYFTLLPIISIEDILILYNQLIHRQRITLWISFQTDDIQFKGCKRNPGQGNKRTSIATPHPISVTIDHKVGLKAIPFSKPISYPSWDSTRPSGSYIKASAPPTSSHNPHLLPFSTHFTQSFFSCLLKISYPNPLYHLHDNVDPLFSLLHPTSSHARTNARL
jgi:hypothetical protein